ncbi:MAG TPA: transferase hexapeptide repeat family protein [Paenalcaligenes sp.]|nr:transferase hexapeptide repeat family protein [Paenalcaligenes sp.]
MAHVFSFDGLIPVVHPSSFIHPNATLIGDVIIGAGCYVGPGAVLRGDFGRIVLKAGSNVQDNCIAHCYPDADVIVEEDGHVGHGVILHGCIIGKNAMVGMNSVVMDHAVVGENAIVGAMAFVKTAQEIPANHLAVGTPARILRELSDQELQWKKEGTEVYQWLAMKNPELLKAVDAPLAEPESDRKRLQMPEYDSLHLRRFKAGEV